ncbi:MAG: hypothetical protein HPY81_03330 [Firmicutes bacterium]|nr:hypothetical protein [Bacillota bacterium]
MFNRLVPGRTVPIPTQKINFSKIDNASFADAEGVNHFVFATSAPMVI